MKDISLLDLENQILEHSEEEEFKLEPSQMTQLG